MSIPTSLIVVLLVVAWLVVLVPMIAKRRDKVPHTQSGGQGFRVLRRAQASLKRRPRRTAKAPTTAAADESAAAAADADHPATERTLVSVGAAPTDAPRDAAEEWAAAQSGGRPRTRPIAAGPVGTDPSDATAPIAVGIGGDAAEPAGYGPGYDAGDHPGDDGAPTEQWARSGGDAPRAHPYADDYPYPDDYPALDDYPAPEDGSSERSLPVQPRVATIADEPFAPAPEPVEFRRPAAPVIADEIDEQEWNEHTAAASAPRSGVDDEALRPTPQRRGRGGYDPEAAEATRAYKYRQRRRVTLALAAAAVVCTALAVLLASWLWIGAVVSIALLALYLTYLRRQVKIEAQIRQRRMERLQRARQIRPEYGRGRPPARSGRSAAGPGRTVVDLDDDDPGFDHLNPYEPPVTYRRAAGQ